MSAAGLPTNDLKPYQRAQLNVFGADKDFSGSRVLEIAGQQSTRVPWWFLERGAREVWVVDPRLTNGEAEGGRVRYISGYAQDLIKENPKPFDYVFGVAIIEHFVDLGNTIDSLAALLRKNGILFFHGSPIWTCFMGHHIWYKGSQSYYFNNEHNPIRPWEHLYLTPPELKARLLESGLLEKDANGIVNYVHFGTDLSRLTYGAIRKIYAGSRAMRPVSWRETTLRSPDPELREKLKRFYPDEPFNIGGIAFELAANHNRS